MVDSIIGAYQVVRTGMAINADDSAYGGNAAITREADIAMGVILGGLFLSSAVYGYVITDECRDFRISKRESEMVVPNTSFPRRQTTMMPT